MKVLITGFDPFGGEKINPAWEAVKGIKDTIEGAKIIKLEIPTVFNKSIEKVKEAINFFLGGKYEQYIRKTDSSSDNI